MKARDVGVRLLWSIVFVFVIGASWVGFDLVSRLLAGRGLPRWSLIMYIAAAFALGCAYIVGEVLWRPIARVLVDPDKVTDPLWRRSLRLLALLTILAVVIAGGVLAEQHGWIPEWLR